LIVVAIAINARDRASIARREPELVVMTENGARESVPAIRPENRFWRAPMRR
jgi:hypothetical protein